MHECFDRFGPVFGLSIKGFGDLVLLADPVDVQATFRLATDVARAGEANRVLEPVLGTESLFVLDGDDHVGRRRTLRKSMRTALEPFDLAWLQSVVEDEVPCDRAIDANELMRWIALRAVANPVLGVQDDAALRNLRTHLDFLTGSFSAAAAFLPPLQRSHGPLTPGYWLHRKLRLAHEELGKLTCQGGLDSSSVARQLLDLRGGRQLDPSTRDDLVTLLLAGDDTVASALSWTLFWLARSPWAQDELCGPNGVPYGADAGALTAVALLESVCLEALRITPVVEVVGRQLAEPVELHGVHLNKGSIISPAMYLVHRNSAVFEDPDVYDPGRFLYRQYAPSEYFPFGGSNRRCLGSNFAMLQMIVIIGTICSLFRIVPDTDDDMRYRPTRRNVTVGPGSPLRLRFLPRRG